LSGLNIWWGLSILRDAKGLRDSAVAVVTKWLSVVCFSGHWSGWSRQSDCWCTW